VKAIKFHLALKIREREREREREGVLVKDRLVDLHVSANLIFMILKATPSSIVA